MKVIGKIAGAVIGLPFGAFGILFGALAGTLVDQVLSLNQKERELNQFLVEGMYSRRFRRLGRPSAGVALMVYLLSLDQNPDRTKKDILLEKFSGFYRLRPGERAFLTDVWNTSLRVLPDLNQEWLIRMFGLSEPDFFELSEMYSYAAEKDRDFLFGLMNEWAGRDELGLTRQEYDFIRKVFIPMGMAHREIRERLKAIPHLNAAYCREMGIDLNCSEQELKRVYREKAAELHPDSTVNIGYSSGDESEENTRREAFSRLQEVYNQLLWQIRISDYE